MNGNMLSPESRRVALEALQSQCFDVLIVGGGVVGAGAALDAASRGLRVALIEARDYASGTSSRSTKLFHGGLRYLEHFDFSLVREALHERSLMLSRLAPHMARPMEILYPLTRPIDRPYVGMGIGVYDALGARKSVPSGHRHLTKGSTLQKFPGGRRNRIRGSILFHEGHIDDARHTLEVVRTAQIEGAVVANSVTATSLLIRGDRVSGVNAVDVESGKEFTIRARATITAVGVWTNSLVAKHVSPGFKITISKGVHITVPRSAIDSSSALISRTNKSVLFVIPWEKVWVIGTTDTPWNGDLAHPAATKADIQYLLDHVNALLESPLTHEDIQGVYVGLRPLVGAGDETTKVSREHQITQPMPGLVCVAGGKYTTYRVMADEAISTASIWLDRRLPPSRTDEISLTGARGLGAIEAWTDQLKFRLAVSSHELERLTRRYGVHVFDLADLVDAQPHLAHEICPGYLSAEVVYAVTHEGALHLDDVMTRRTRISIDTADRGFESCARVGELIAPHLGWTPEKREEEIDGYRSRLIAEKNAQESITDAESDIARLAARDSRPLAS